MINLISIIKIAVLVLGVILLPIGICTSYFQIKETDEIQYDLITIPLHNGINLHSAHFTPSGNILIYSNENDSDIFGVINISDNYSYREIYKGTISPLYKSNGVRVLPFLDNKRVLLGDYVLECLPNLDECTTSHSRLVPIIYPSEVVNNNNTMFVWSEIIPSPDLNHIGWTTLILPTGAINYLGTLDRTPSFESSSNENHDNNANSNESPQYMINNIQIISSLSFTEEDPNKPGYIRFLPLRGGEIKQFVRGGGAITLAGASTMGIAKSVFQDLEGEDVYPLSHVPGYDETMILSPDEKLGITMSSRFSSNTNMAILGHLPVPWSVIFLSKLNQVAYNYAITSVRAGKHHGNIGPVLVEVKKSIEDPDYVGIGLQDPDDEYIFVSPMSWHPNSTLALWPEVERGNNITSKRRIRMVRIKNWKPGNSVKTVKTPDKISYAQSLSAMDNLSILIKSGKIQGDKGGTIEFNMSLISASVIYDQFTEDGQTFFNGWAKFQNYGEQILQTNIKMTGKQDGEMNFRMHFSKDSDLLFDLDNDGKPKSYGYSTYKGITLDVNQYK